MENEKMKILWILATFQSTWCCARTRRARKYACEILAPTNGYRMKNWICFVFTMYSYLQNSQRWKHLNVFEFLWIFMKIQFLKFFQKIWKSKIWKFSFFHFPSNFEVLYLCEFLNYDNDQIMKKHLFLLKNMILIFLLARAHSSARCAPRYILQKCGFW